MKEPIILELLHIMTLLVIKCYADLFLNFCHPGGFDSHIHCTFFSCQNMIFQKADLAFQKCVSWAK